ncbi:MAG: rod shape-determining protein RodA [Armatimonadetes bacterium]|nr:rod shape-determining protein RodA [Armatimonadota bacterium]
MPRKLTQRLDWTLLVAVLLLTVVGCLMIYSATRAEMGARKLMLQLVWVALGLVLLASVTIVDYNRLVNLAMPFLGFCTFLLVVVLFTGHLVKGAERWIPLGPLNVQPAELLKLGLILFLGGFLATREEEAHDFGLVLTSLAYVGVPTLLVLAQPDLGTPVLLFFVWLTMLFVVGSKVTHLGAIAFAFLMLFTAAWGLNIIRPHQKERLTAFMNPEADPRGQGWNLRQSLIAIGSGHVFGQGLFKGTQSRLRFVPEQETDFIFTVVGEELGFVGSVAVLAIFGLVLYRSLSIAATAKDTAGRLIASGITAMLLVHIVVNVGMTLGMMPVKGMPLPFVSYGGSSMLTMMAAVGLLQSIHIHRQKITF